MAEGAIDVLMRVQGPEGPIAAESSTEFATMQITDGLRDGFVPGFFCELREFNFSAGVAKAIGKDDNKSTATKLAEAQAKLKRQEERKSLYATMTEQQKRADAISRLDKTQDKLGGKRGAGDFVDMQPVEFTRVLDQMSSRLFQSLVDCETLEKISVVKRKATGSRNTGDCYLRLDFEKVLVTNLEWKDSEHIILENGTFIYRKMTIRYRPQKPDGTLGAVIQSEWEMQSARKGG